MTRRLVQCDDAFIPQTWAAEYSESAPIHLNRLGPSAQVTLRLHEEVSDPLAGTLQGRAFDLVSIAAYVYVADQLVSRGGSADIYGDNWRRELAMCVPVGDPDFWNIPRVRTLLEQTLNFVSGETWHFIFAASHPGPRQLKLNVDERGVRHNPDSVVLFSGGADSLCATVEAVMDRKLKPVLVSHQSVPLMGTIQGNLADQLKHTIPSWQFPQSHFVINKVKTNERDTTQRTRSFLFASLGTAVASSLGIKTVILADNGVVSLNLPINNQLLGSLASRSTHPKFIDHFNSLAKTVLPNEPQVSNPLSTRTRAECLEVLKRHGVERLLMATNSCAHRRNLSTSSPQCGVCSQCVDRRFASLDAGLESVDPANRYRTEIFRDALDGDVATMVESYCRFVRKVEPLSAEDLFIEYPQLAEAILPSDPSPSKTLQQYAEMIHRHAVSVLGVAAQQVTNASQELVMDRLPPTCGIRLSLPAATSPSSQLESPDVTLSEQEEQEFERHRFKCRLPVRVTGQTEGRKSNVVTIGGHEVILPDAQFKLFLRLVVALYETNDGFVDRGQLKQGGGLVDEEVYFPEELDQAAGRLRWRVGPALEGLKAKKYIEVQRKKIRLSTHRACVSVDREALLKHSNDQIRLLAARLRNNAAS